jgi:hypothetical protein
VPVQAQAGRANRVQDEQENIRSIRRSGPGDRDALTEEPRLPDQQTPCADQKPEHADQQRPPEQSVQQLGWAAPHHTSRPNADTKPEQE